MATKKQTGTGSSFSITDDLFGSKDSISTSGIFDSIFPPPSTAGRRNFHGSEFLGSMQKQQSWRTGSGIAADNGNKNWKGGSSNRSNVLVAAAAAERNSNFQQKVEPPCPLSSSLYYGGQEDMYGGTVSNQNGILKKTMTENDPYGNNSNDASRGNWWQGSLYY